MSTSKEETTNLNSIDSSDFYRDLFMNSKQNAMILMDTDGYVLQINKAFEDHFGYTQNDLEGKHTRIFFTPEDQNLKKPEMEIASVKEQGAADDNNYLVHKDGSLVWVTGESILVTTDNGSFISKVVHNIHTQKVMERFLIETNELVESVLKTIKDALVVVDIDLRILKANKSFYQTFEIPEETIEGILLYDLNYAFWNEKSMQSKLETMIEENEFFQTNQFQWKKPDGSVRIFNVTAKNMDYSADKSKRILIVISDITVERELEQQKEDLIGFVTHELRNPLANMALCAELMQDSIKDNKIEETDEYLNKTRTNIKRLNTVVSELHDATRAGSGQLQINKQLIQFETLVDDAIETVRHLHPSHTILKTGNAPVEVYADRHRLLQVLNNYLTNAIKYCPTADKIVINLSITEEGLVTSVRDYGTGIPSSKIPHIFNRYYRIENSRATDGLGLGLYLSKEIINAHNGKVWVESEENVGSVFYFSLPLK
ncbi:MAG TPA: PAS domain-containing sensor histidine kinase [Flavitalea sp.]|nr:PAS domain-containing sensor histidine kinase [Flavitalea sp.]